MSKARLLASVAFVFSPIASAAVPPVERLEGESMSEGDPDRYAQNYYLSDEDLSAPPSEGDDDLGEQIILHRQKKWAPVRLRADTFLFWSNNLASASSGEDDGWFYGGSLSLRWKQRLSANLFFDAYAYQDAYLYDSDGLDFQSSEIGAGLIANLPFLDDLTVFGRYEFLYIHSDNPLFGALDPNEHNDNQYHRLRVGAHKPLLSIESHTVGLSTNASWDFEASSGTPRRQQISARLAYSWSATDRLRATTFYRVSFRDYLGSGREDWNQYLGLELNYSLNSWSEVYGSILFGVNDSNLPGGTRDYETLQGGLGIGVRASF